MTRIQRRVAKAPTTAPVVQKTTGWVFGLALAEQPDATEAAMMALCDAHLADLALYNTGHGPDGEGPLWDRIESTGAKLREWEPRTFAGVLKAAQMVEALGAKSEAAVGAWDSNYTRHWPETALRAVLRLGGAA